MPNKNTFTILPIKQLLHKYCDEGKVIIEPFANKSKWGTIRNDLNPEYDTEYHMDALEFLKQFENEYADVVLYDPPFSIHQAQFGNDEVTYFVGIAYDEPIRWERMLKKQTEKRKYRSLLVEQKLTEQDAFEICKKYDLLSPMYSVNGIYRGGCWFCPKQCLADLHSLWKNYPELFDILIEMEKVSINTFKPNGVTLSSLAERFAAGDIPKRRKKRQTSVQMDMFKDLK